MIESFLSEINCIINNKIIKPTKPNNPPVTFIIFADPVVKQICVENWGSNGEITYEQAAAVTDLSNKFSNNTEITSFNELQYFNSVTSIDENAFQNCTGLISMEIPNFITSIGNSAFNGCSNLNLIILQSIEPPILEINAFLNTNLTNIYVPAGSVNAYKTAPYWSDYASIISASQISPTTYITFADPEVERICIENWSSDGTGLTYEEAAGIEDLQYTFSGNNTINSFNELQYFISLTSINNDSFHSCSALESITIPNSITSIKNNAFRLCSSLKYVNIPNSVIELEGNVFQQCTNLEEITLSNQLTSIGSYSFYGCSFLKSIVIPQKVNNINLFAFAGCDELESIIIESLNPPVTDPSIFGETLNLQNIFVPAESVDTYKAAAGWSEYANLITAIAE